MKPKAPRFDALVEELGRLRLDPTVPGAAEVIHEALRHKHWMPVERASALVAQHVLVDYANDLLAVWGRFLDPAAKLDPGCRAKEAALRALDTLEWWDADPFLAAVRYVQMEPAYGPPVDTAGGIRQRALSALLRLHHSHALLYAGELLADPSSTCARARPMPSANTAARRPVRSSSSACGSTTTCGC